MDKVESKELLEGNVDMRLIFDHIEKKVNDWRQKTQVTCCATHYDIDRCLTYVTNGINFKYRYDHTIGMFVFMYSIKKDSDKDMSTHLNVALEFLLREILPVTARFRVDYYEQLPE